MYSKDMLIGILLGMSKCDIYIEKNDSSQIGYRGNKDFLIAVQRSLAQHQIESKFKETEHKGRPRPILRIGGIKTLFKLMLLVPIELPDANNEWATFRECVDIVSNGRHLQLEGLERLFELKGVE
jgi:hypothetical protein